MKRSLFVVFCLATMVYAGAAYAYDTVTDCAATACNVQNTYTVVGQSATGCTDTMRHVMNVVEIGRFIIVRVVKVDIHTVQKHFILRQKHP